MNKFSKFRSKKKVREIYFGKYHSEVQVVKTIVKRNSKKTSRRKYTSDNTNVTSKNQKIQIENYKTTNTIRNIQRGRTQSGKYKAVDKSRKHKIWKIQI